MQNVALTIHQLFRYVYGGLIVLLVLAIDSTSNLCCYKNSLGTVGSIAAISALGILLYGVCRVVLIMIVANTLHHVFHRWLWHDFLKGWPTQGACKVAIMRDLYRPRQEQRRGSVLNRFRYHRDNIWPEDARQHFRDRHSENYVLYLTCASFGLLWFGSWFGLISLQQATVSVVGWGALALLAIGIIEDYAICSFEALTLEGSPERLRPNRERARAQRRNSER